MKKKYYKACVDAGLTKEQIQVIKRIFDSDAKRRKRANEKKKRAGYRYVSLDHLRDDTETYQLYQAADPVVDIERQIIHQMDLDYLDECLSQLSEFDRNLLLEFYDGQRGIETRMAKKYGMERMQFRRYRKSLEKQIREKFLKKFGE